MQVEFRSNGRLEIELTPETEIEAAFMRAFLTAAVKGATVKLSPAGEAPTGMVLELAK